MLVDLGEPLLRVVEIKSLDKDEFKKLVAPKGEHWYRTSLYFRIIDDSDHPYKDKINLKEGIVFYVSKGYGNKCDDLKEAKAKDAHISPFKEYFVKRQDDEVQEIWERAKVLHQFRTGTGKMPHGICPNSMCKRACACTMIKHCWSGSFPAGM